MMMIRRPGGDRLLLLRGWMIVGASVNTGIQEWSSESSMDSESIDTSSMYHRYNK